MAAVLKAIIRLGMIAAVVLTAGCNSPEKEVYLFSFFKGNGEDGLHLARSHDGLRWNALNHDRSFLTPQAGTDKLMRDPCILQDKDCIFHMV